MYLQLVPHSLFVGNGKQQVQTRLLSVECCNNDCEEVKTRLRECLSKIVDEESTGSTKNMRFVPLRDDDVTSTEVLKQLV